MNLHQVMVRNFHEKYGASIKQRPQVPNGTIRLLRSSLIIQEAAEFVDAAREKDLVGMVDALGDLLYVVYGTAVSLGVDMEPVFEEIHESNMTKAGGLSAGGKMGKGKGYIPPKVEEVLITQGMKGK